jgi:peptidoglycan glycosyltransferase
LSNNTRPVVVIAVVAALAIAVAVPVWWLLNRRGTDIGGTPGRGPIVVDGVAVVTGDRPRAHRSGLYAHLVGAYGDGVSSTGIEATENAHLAAGGEVRLTLRSAVQEAAWQGLDGNKVDAERGAVVVLDASTGAILAAVSKPGPEPDVTAADAESAVNRAWSVAQAPGAAFGSVVAAAAIDGGLGPDTQVEAGARYVPPGSTVALQNPRQADCPDTMLVRDAVARACYTAYARLGVKLGAGPVRDKAAAFGFDADLTFARDPANVFGVERSTVGPVDGDPIALAQACLGQRDVRMTALQGAVIAATVANGGDRMRPYLVDELVDTAGGTVFTAEPERLGSALSREGAGVLGELMRYAVASGTARRANVAGIDVSGLTGSPVTPSGNDAWFIGYARGEGGRTVAVAVFLAEPSGPGSAEAARIGGSVLAAAVR